MTIEQISGELSLSELLRNAAKRIELAPELRFQSPVFEARLLLEFASGQSHSWLIAHGSDVVNKMLSKEQIDLFSASLQARLSGKPIAFIMGTQDFWTLQLKVSDCTLIPRQDSEIVVETALSLPISDSAKVLDLGSGTGAIALALASERKQWQVTGVDRIEPAVILAQENAKLNKLKVRFLQSNWFDVFKDAKPSEHFDLIVSNPPYVEQNSDYLKQGDLRFEPLSALTSGSDGLDDIRYIIKKAKHYLSPNAYLIIEHGNEQGEAVKCLFEESGFGDVDTKHDLNNLPRITLGRWV